MKITVVTTFNQKGLTEYAQRMIDSFSENWPIDVTLQLYPENCNPSLDHVDNASVYHLTNVPELEAFKNKWSGVPMATGWCDDSTKKHPDKTQRIGFKWDAVRFSHKVYSIFHCASHSKADLLIWMDADTICHSPITIEEIERLCPPDKDLCFLGRKGKYSECGLYAMNLKSDNVRAFLSKFQRYYDDANNGIFTLSEWHDSFVFDAVRKQFDLNELDWSGHLITGEGHPLINSEWGAYLDHLKGDRKQLTRSNLSDLKVTRTEAYWQ
jgi:hypothetical protein